jgi:hypothetical protein
MGGKMRTIRMLSLAALAALSLVASVSPGSASATTLCSVNFAVCPLPARYPMTTALVLFEEPPAPPVIVTTVKGEPFAIECEELLGEGQTLVESGAPLTVTIAFPGFEGCVSPRGACTVEDLNPGYEGLLEAAGGGNGTLLVEAGGGGGPPGLEFKCGGGLTCLYAAESVEFQVTGGNPAAVLSEAPLTRQAGSLEVCGENATLSSEYVVTSPAPLFVAAFP